MFASPPNEHTQDEEGMGEYGGRGRFNRTRVIRPHLNTLHPYIHTPVRLSVGAGEGRISSDRSVLVFT